jgi:hypothetical protein
VAQAIRRRQRAPMAVGRTATGMDMK